MVFQLRKWLSIAFTFARVSHLLKKGFATDIFPATWLTSFTNLIRQIELEMLLFVYTWKLIRYARHLQQYQMFPQAKIWYMSNECIIGKKKCFLPRKNPLFLAVNKVTNAFQSGRKISFPTSLQGSPIFLQSNSCHRNPLRLSRKYRNYQMRFFTPA